MSIISAVRDYLKGYSGLATGAPVWVDLLGSSHTQYVVVMLPGERIQEQYLNGGSLRVFPFALQSMQSTADDLERLETGGFYELFADWLEQQTAVGALPQLTNKKTAVRIEATSWAYLYEQGQSDTGIYNITCRLVYEQEP